jgi:hypothetical protein
MVTTELQAWWQLKCRHGDNSRTGNSSSIFSFLILLVYETTMLITCSLNRRYQWRGSKLLHLCGTFWEVHLPSCITRFFKIYFSRTTHHNLSFFKYYYKYLLQHVSAGIAHYPQIQNTQILRIYFFLTFMWPCIVTNFFVIKPTKCIRVAWQNKFVKLMHLVGFIFKKKFEFILLKILVLTDGFIVI